MPWKQVCWNPFSDLLAGRLPGDVIPISRFHGTITFMDVSEPYMPDRVLRQFGYIQTIPRPVIRPTRAARPVSARQYVVRYQRQESFWEQFTSHLLSAAALGSRAMPAWRCADDYMSWFERISHLRVANPNLLGPDDQMPIQRPMTAETVRNFIYLIFCYICK